MIRKKNVDEHDLPCEKVPVEQYMVADRDTLHAVLPEKRMMLSYGDLFHSR